jgi:hypothetical protein
MPLPRPGLPSCWACALITAILLSNAPAVLGGSQSDPPVASDPVFSALTVDGGSISGRIRQFGSQGELTLVTVEGPERIIPLQSLVKLTREGVNANLTPEPAVVIFPEGDRLYRTAIVAANETHLDVQSYSLDKLSIPLESLLGLGLPHGLALPADAEALEALTQKVRNETRTSEVVWLANGDRLSGGFLGLTDKMVRFQLGKSVLELDRLGVVALGFDPALVVYPKPKTGFLELTLSDGSRLGVTGPRIEQGHVLATTRFGASIRVPIAELLRIHARTQSVVYLSERPVGAERYVPYVGPPRPFRLDGTVEGHVMRLSGQEYDRGIGTQSRTLLAYRLEPGDRRFQAMVGVDDRAGPLGSVIFRILVDNNKEVFASPPLSARDTPRAIDVDLAGAKTLILITEFGDRGGVRDLADWVEARIIR